MKDPDPKGVDGYKKYQCGQWHITWGGLGEWVVS